jgi:hypothetical protein
MSGNSSDAKPSAKPNIVRPSADSVRGDSDTFVSFMRKLVQVPHSEIKAELDAEKEMRQVSKLPVFRVPRALSKRVN